MSHADTISKVKNRASLGFYGTIAVYRTNTAFSGISMAASKSLKLLMSMNTAYKIKEIDNCIFVIDNRERLVNFLVNSNQSKDCHKQITTWDFSTPYTKIPHSKLKENISFFVKKVFECVKHSKKAAN